MPIPTDPWLAARHFGIVIDAGSSGSRLQIYSWKDPSIVVQESGESVYRTLPKVEKGARDGEEWVTKVEPGLSFFADNPEGISAYLAPLLSHAREQVPPSLQSDTPLFLLATAGMRLLTSEQQGRVLQTTCHFLRFHSNFRIEDSSPMGPCGSSVRIITGEEEGLFGWIAVNYLMDGFTASASNQTTFGFLDMGGASTQIAFEPSKAEREKHPENLKEVRLRLLGGEEIHHEVFVTTWLGYGTNQARERYVGRAINEYEATRPQASSHEDSTEGELVPDPCLPKNLELLESPVHTGASTSHSRKAHRLVGTGSFEQCLRQTSPLLNKDAPCPDTPCLFNGVHVPPIDFSVSHFIGISEYWYSSEHVFGLGGPYDFVQYERAASEFCARDWSGLMDEHEKTRQQGHGHLGGDGEVVQGGRVVEIGKWGDKVEIPRLQMQCFKAAWLANVLHEGIGLPRIVDPGGNATTDGDKVADQAAHKGLGSPAFQSLDTVGDIAISWTLGMMVLEASKEVPSSAKGRPLVDSIQSTPSQIEPPLKSAHPPFLDLDAIEDHIEHHLPSSLTRESLGFSPVGLFIYSIFLFAIFFVVYRLRHYIAASFRRFIRGPFKRDRDIKVRQFSLEEGTWTGSPASPTLFSKWIQSFRRLISTPQRPRLSPISTSSQKPLLRHMPPSPSRISPTRSYSLPSSHHSISASHSSSTTTASSTQFLSRPSSPAPGFVDDNGILSNSASSLASLARSRNSSQINLSTLVPRQTPISRAGGTLHIPNGGSFRDE